MQRVFFAFPYEYDRDHSWYRKALRDAVNSIGGVHAIFADEAVMHGHILDHISQCIDQSEIGFYDITGLNPNVLIEFGIGRASDKPCFLLLNTSLHQTEVQSFWGKRTTPLPIPADLMGILRYEYGTATELAGHVRRAIEQNLSQVRAGDAMAQRIVKRLVQLGPANMSTIAQDIKQPIDDVRPILRSLVTQDRVVREGGGRGTKYRVP